jgi:Fe-S cluster biogenesis protein NfuA/nitrite reductase/ring-hydroxylating ferredoxin subunit
MRWDDRQTQERIASLERLLGALESFEHGPVQATAMQTVEALVNVYGETLARMMERIQQADPGLAEALAEDDLIAHLLLIHDLHPVDVETRVARALESVRPLLRSRGADVELLGVQGGVARVRLQTSGSGCASSGADLTLVVEDVLRQAAPELDRLETEPTPAPVSELIPPESLFRQHDQGKREEATPQTLELWVAVGELSHLEAGGAPLLMEVLGEPMLFVKLDDAFHAYRPACPACGESLGHAMLHASELTCAACQRRYDLRRAGACPDAPKLHLKPIPLLGGAAEGIKVAVGAGGGLRP